ncbi:MAG TPA: GNAT family N-acetyltransferase [Ktedonobacteraceae bacterium]
MQAQGNQIFETKHLQLVPFSLELIKATLEGTSKLGERLGVRVPEAWPGGDFAEILPALVAEMEAERSETAWNWLIVHKEDRTIVGDVGFMSGPSDGRAEIGYSIVEAYRNLGYATEAALYLIHWALQQPEIRQVTAQCLDDNVGSIKVLEKIGMQQREPDGQMLQWETRFPYSGNI